MTRGALFTVFAEAYLGVVVDAAQLARPAQLKVRLVRVVHVPDVRALAHALRLLLEVEDGVRDGALAVVHIRVPADVARRPLDLRRVAEHRQRLGERLLGGVVRHGARKVLLVNVDGVVLLD